MNMRHTDHEFENELEGIRENVARMGGLVESMLADGMRAFSYHDMELAARVMDNEHEVDRLEVETDELCLKVLACRQPMGIDLRFVSTTLKLVKDLERMGDLCVSIAERASELTGQPAGDVPEENLAAMTQDVRGMVRDALKSFIAADVPLARKVIEADRAVDARYAQAFRQLLNLMTENPSGILAVTRVQAVAKYLERIGDHATNLAEMVVFMVQGKDIRHAKSMGRIQQPPSRGILFLCVHNAARSQMAEALARNLFPPTVEVWSAGSDRAEGIDPGAVEAMREIGIDISSQRPKRISDVPLDRVDTVITLCPEELCVTIPGIARKLTWALPDPAARSDSNVIAAYRQVRDQLLDYIKRLPELSGK